MRAVTSSAGLRTETDLYRPFGDQLETVQNPAAVIETKGYIGERLDAAVGLEYLNARYYDPRMGMFLQPDWWEVTKKGVGTNRYAYSFNDPINGRDVSGHCLEDACIGEAIVAEAAAAAIEGCCEAVAEAIGSEVVSGAETAVETTKSLAQSVKETLTEAIGVRTEASKGFAEISKELSGIAANKAKGAVGESVVKDVLEKAGYEVTKQVRAVTKAGVRVMDFVVKDPVTKNLVQVEVKVDGATVSVSQAAKDAAAATEGATLQGGRVPGIPKGTTQKMETVVANVDSNAGAVKSVSQTTSTSGGLGDFFHELANAIESLF